MFHSVTLKENESHTAILSGVKCFCCALERKCFVENVQECLGLRYFIRLCNIADEDGPRLESWSVVQCTLLNKGPLIRPNIVLSTIR